MSTADPGSGPGDKKLNDIECKLVTAAVTGTLVDLRCGDTELDSPAHGISWNISRQVRAERLIELLTEAPHLDGKRPRAVKLRGARITGPLNLEAATLACPLMLQDCYIDEPVNLDEAVASAIRMPGCRLTSLTASQLRTTGDLTLNAGFTATSGLCLLGAHIGGQLSLTGARLANPDGPALDADLLSVDLDMLCRNGFTTTGEMRLPGAHIGGQLSLTGAQLRNPDGPALTADQITIDQGMFCARGFKASGEIRLMGAHIGGQLDLSGAALSNRQGPAFNADELTVKLSMFCDRGFKATGEIQLLGAHIGGQLVLAGATLANRRGPALTADEITIDGSMHCADEFTATSEIRLRKAHIGGQLTLRGANLASPSGVALDLEAADIYALLLLPQKQPGGAVNLTNTRVGTFADDPASWPAVLHLQGFAYDTLENNEVSVRSRLRWLTRHADGYTPQLYDQLTSTYRRAGNEQAARKAAVAKQWRRRRAFNPLNWLWYLTVGYGYRPWLAGIWLVGLIGFGTWIFSDAYPAHMIALSPHPPAFHAAAYVLDLLLPVIGLGQKAAWQSQGSAYQYWSWALTGAGWVLTTALVAGLTGILKRD